MTGKHADIILIRGAPAAGKSQAAKCLARYFPKGVRMEVDNLRSMVISAEWTNQVEHINMLDLSTTVLHEFLKLGFRPVIVVDTFSNGKIVNYLNKLRHLDSNLSIRVVGLYTSDEELRRRIQARKSTEFRDYPICQQQNDDVRKNRYSGERQVDTTGLSPEDTAKAIYCHLNTTRRKK